MHYNEMFRWIFLTLLSVLWLRSLPTRCAITDEQTVDTAEAVVEEDHDGEESIQIVPFIPTREWQVVDDGQSIPPGLHVRINLATGLKEAKLLDPEEGGEADHVLSVARSDKDILPVGMATPHQAFKPTGDQRRLHHYGTSDRRGVINKKTKPFTQQELAEALQEQDRHGGVQGITYSSPVRESDGGCEGE